MLKSTTEYYSGRLLLGATEMSGEVVGDRIVDIISKHRRPGIVLFFTLPISNLMEAHHHVFYLTTLGKFYNIPTHNGG
jgi:hypothetical protein